MDFFFGAKSKLRSFKDLEANVRQAIAHIMERMLDRVINKWSHRLRQCVQSHGGHLNDYLFRT